MWTGGNLFLYVLIYGLLIEKKKKFMDVVCLQLYVFNKFFIFGGVWRCMINRDWLDSLLMPKMQFNSLGISNLRDMLHNGGG